MNLKKTYSLITKEMLNVMVSLEFIVLGIIKLIHSESPIENGLARVVLIVTIFLTFAAIFFRSLGRFDIVDEAAQEHYNRAKRSVLDFIWGFVCGATVIMAFLGLLADSGVAPFEITFVVNAWWLMIVYGLIQLAISVYFIYLEKREA